MISPVRWDGERLVLLDQTRLPTEEVEQACASWPEVARRHPPPGRARRAGHRRRRRLRRGARRAGEPGRDWAGLARRPRGGHRGARRHAPDRGQPVLGARPHAAPPRPRSAELAALAACGPLCSTEARRILDEDIAANRASATTAPPSCPRAARVLTHCNAGALATAGYGTALGVIRAAPRARQGSRRSGWTRPGRAAGRAADRLGAAARGHPVTAHHRQQRRAR